MWSSSNQRIKALMSARQREKDRLTRPIYVRRAELVLRFRSEDDFLVEVPARALLNDFTPAGFYAYAATRLNPNVEITLQLDHPKHFNLTAKIVWCQYQASSAHVVSSTQNYPYRIALAMLWKDSLEEEEFKKFCFELSDLYISKKGLFIEEAFPKPNANPSAAVQPTATLSAVPDPMDVPPTTESDEGAAPSEEQLTADLAADRILAGDSAPSSSEMPNAETPAEASASDLSEPEKEAA
ncbi:MAG: hypothetical protein H7301_13465 [Cryobacterium sp.]|nr:hypothetical protein [Oligoflexia bacterium]